MRRDHAAKVMGAALAVLMLGAVGLPRCQAQMHYSGGFVHHREHRPSNTLRPTPPPESSGPPFAYNDFYYPTFSSPAPAARRSYYPTEDAGSTLSSFGVSAAALPWNQAGFQDYAGSSESPLSTARKYSLVATALPRQLSAEQLPNALVIVRLPEQAMLWVEERRIPLQGRTSLFRSPALAAGKKYDYTVRTAWLEEGRWVSHTRDVTVEAGQVVALYLRPAPNLQARKP